MGITYHSVYDSHYDSRFSFTFCREAGKWVRGILLLCSGKRSVQEEHSYVFFHSVQTGREGWHLRKWQCHIGATFIVQGGHRCLKGGRGQKIVKPQNYVTTPFINPPPRVNNTDTELRKSGKKCAGARRNNTDTGAPKARRCEIIPIPACRRRADTK